MNKFEKQDTSNKYKWWLIFNFSELLFENWFKKELVMIPFQKGSNLLKTKNVEAGFLVWWWSKFLKQN